MVMKRGFFKIINSFPFLHGVEPCTFWLWPKGSDQLASLCGLCFVKIFLKFIYNRSLGHGTWNLAFWATFMEDEHLHPLLCRLYSLWNQFIANYNIWVPDQTTDECKTTSNPTNFNLSTKISNKKSSSLKGSLKALSRKYQQGSKVASFGRSSFKLLQGRGLSMTLIQSPSWIFTNKRFSSPLGKGYWNTLATTGCVGLNFVQPSPLGEGYWNMCLLYWVRDIEIRCLPLGVGHWNRS